jgi:tetratricopeptide (TPR) repeat protein
MEEYRQAADVLFHTCFALARRGQTAMAENMLAAIAAKAQGLPGVVAQVNLATLLRQEYKLSAALRLYRKSILKLLNLRAFIQLAQVLSEIAVIHRQMGHLGRSVIFLESSAALNHILKNHTSAAIAHSQLSSTYRYLKMYGLAARNSKLAICHFRQTNDFLNLGRSLLTQGNIYFNQHKAKQALQSFNEAYEIGLRIADAQAETGAVSGKARVFIFQNRYDEAQELLEQAISLRERHNDHTVGIEYQNMAVLYEKRGNFAMSLGWYQKALTQFEKYMPVEVPVCKRQIALAQKKYRK